MDAETIENERTKIREHLVRLGNTMDEVAATLRADSGRYKGVPNNYRDCPVAHYVHEVSPGSDVGRTRVEFGRTGDPATGVPMPGPVAEFVDAFDQNPEDYPELLWCYEKRPQGN